MRYCITESDVFEVGSKIFSRLDTNKEGKIITIYDDPILQEQLIGVKWKDGSTDLVLSKWVISTNPWELWHESGPEGKGLSRKKEEIRGNETTLDAHSNIDKSGIYKNLTYFASLKKDMKPITSYSKESSYLMLAPILQKKLGYSDEQVEEFLFKSNTNIVEDDKLLIERSGKAILCSISDLTDIRFFNRGIEVTSRDFLNETDDGKLIIIRASDGYIISWGGGKYLVDPFELQEFLNEYEINTSKVVSSIQEYGKAVINLV